MTNIFSNLSTFLLWATVLALISGCQSQVDVGPAQLPPVTATLLPELTPSPTPSPTPIPQLEPDAVENQTLASSYELVPDFASQESDKLSDIVFYPPRETLFAVRDNGRMIEVKTDGTFIREKNIREDADFEGITYNPDSGMLYVVVEGEEIIFEIDPETLSVARVILIDRSFEGNLLLSPEGDGVEGITYVPAADGSSNGSFYLVNQADSLIGNDSSIVVEVKIDSGANDPRAQIVRYFSVGISDLSGISYIPSNHRLLITSDTNDLLLDVDLNGQVVGTYPLPGKNQEGIAIDEEGSLYIAQDTKKAPLKLKLIPNSATTSP